jgi:hypothetical protein
VNAIVWAGDSSSLTDAQRRALDRWVAAGGNLIVLGGPDWQARTAAFADLLPVTGLSATDGISLTPLAEVAGNAALPEQSTATIATGSLADGAIQLASVSDNAAKGSPLLASISRGSGRVTYLAADLAADPLRAWQGSPLLLGRLIPDNRVAVQFIGAGPSDDDVASSIAQALGNIPALEVPPAELLLAVIVGYILLIGPISYIVLRRRDRRDLAWVTAPLLVLVFSAGTYGIGWSLKGSQVILNELAIVRTTSGSDAASVQTFAGVFSPSRSTYDLTVKADALLTAVNTSSNFGRLDTSTGQYQIEQGNPAHLRGLAVSVFGLQAVRADAVVAYRSALDVSWRLQGDAVVGTVRNTSDHPLEDVAVIGSGSGLMVGTLQPGSQRDFRLTTTTNPGQPVSEQVYGSGGVDTSSPSLRQTAMRRQVIDSLTGFGAFGGKLGFPVAVPLVGSIGLSGPMVLGWTTDTTPLDVSVDGVSAQHYRQSVEVVSGSPAIGSGQATLGPSLLPVSVVSTSGDASQQTPGGVMMSKGEAVFRIGLPLEAARLQATALTLYASQDPGALFAAVGNAGGFPQGYRMALLRPATGAWEDLGELGGVATFSVQDPATAIDAGGQITVRVTANSNAGGAQVFVGASVTGVIP